jgi:hypothetical protein
VLLNFFGEMEKIKNEKKVSTGLREFNIEKWNWKFLFFKVKNTVCKAKFFCLN